MKTDKTNENFKLLRKQGYRVVKGHSITKICDWCRRALVGRGECYKYKFYGIPSWRCMQFSPWLACENKCIHCWRPIELDMNKLMDKKKIISPEEILEGCIVERKKLLTGFGGNDKVDKKRYKEAQEPSHFAISLIGEPTLYPKIGEMVALLRKRGKTSFIVSNGLHPEIFKKLEKKKQLPTQLYVSLNSSNKKDYDAWQRSKMKNAWKKYNETLDFMKKITEKGKRTVLRMTIVRGMNIDDKHIREFAELIKKSGAMFVEVKSFMSLGYARPRIGFDAMPRLKEVEDFSKKLAKAAGYLVLDKHELSRIVLLGKNAEAKRRMKIKPEEI